jgi:hypothetical protein
MEPVGESESAELAERATASRNMSKQGEDSHENDNADGPWATWCRWAGGVLQCD